MNVITYEANNYVPKVALVVDDSSELQLLVGSSLQETTGELDDYVTAVQSVGYSTDTLQSSAYDLFTIDIYGYRELYMLVGDSLRQVFSRWQTLLTSMLSQSLRSELVNGTTCSIAALSMYQGQYVDFECNAKMQLNAWFQQSGVVAARLVNIAVPKSWNVTRFFYANEHATALDDHVQTMQLLQHSQVEYFRSDFRYLSIPQGQQFTFRVVNHARFNVQIADVNGYLVKTLAYNASIAELRQLEAYCSVSIAGDYCTVQFVYNPNRNYVFTGNVPIVSQDLLSTYTIQVLSSDMRQHASLLGILINGQYMLQSDASKPASITLAAAYSSIRVNELSIRSWNHSNYNYSNWTSINNLQWTAANYHFVPVQCGDANYQLSWFHKTNGVIAYGNMHTFLLESTSVQYGNAYIDFHTGAPLTALDSAFAQIDLPVIYDAEVTYRNIKYRMEANNATTNDFDGRKFATVVRHVADLAEITAELVISANYVVFLINANLTAILDKANKTAVNSLTIDDFYNASATQFMPRLIASYASRIRGYYSVNVDVTTARLDMELPLV